MRQAQLRHVAALVAAAACWGGGTAVSKQAVAEVPPLSLMVLQLAVSVAVISVGVISIRAAAPAPAPAPAS